MAFFQWSLVQLSAHHGHFPHVGTSLRTWTRITSNTYPITYVITLILNRFSLSPNTFCFATSSIKAIMKVYNSSVLTEYLDECVEDLFVCLPFLNLSRHNFHLLYLLAYHYYHQNIDIILRLNMLYPKKKINNKMLSLVFLRDMRGRHCRKKIHYPR